MACLNYRPSAVHIGEGSYERLDLFDRMDSLLSKAHDQMRFSCDAEDLNHLRSFSHGDLEPERVATVRNVEAEKPNVNSKVQAKPTFVLPALSAR